MKDIFFFLFAVLLAVGFLVLAGVLGNFDAEAELAMLESKTTLTEGFELLCADATQTVSDGSVVASIDSARSLHVSHQERMDRFLLRCVVR